MVQDFSREERVDHIHDMLCQMRGLYLEADGEALRYFLGMAAVEAHRLLQATPTVANAGQIEVQRLYMADSLDGER